MVDIQRFFRLILFNFVTSNDDAHLKNFSLIEHNGEYRLSPAYDLVNTALQLREPRIFALNKGLFREGMAFSDTRTIRRADFEEFGRRIGLPEKVVRKEIELFLSDQPLTYELLERSFLSEELKKQYRQTFDYRRHILGFLVGRPNGGNERPHRKSKIQPASAKFSAFGEFRDFYYFCIV